MKKTIDFASNSINVMINILIVLLFVTGCARSSYHAPVQDIRQPPSEKINWHKVDVGDTLYSIAWRYDLTVSELARYNRISSKAKIYEGQKLSLEASNSWVARPKAIPKVTHKTVPKIVPIAKTSPRVNLPKVVTVRQPKHVKKKVTSPPRAVKKPSKKQIPRPKKRSIKKTLNENTKKASNSQFSTIDWAWPVQGKIIEEFSLKHPSNKGIDIAGKLGESIRTASAGTIVYSGEGLRGYGKLLIIKHNQRFLSAYAHNHRLLVKEGDKVVKGQSVATMGSTGTNRVKLHFEIRREGKPVDPMPYLTKNK